MVLTSCSNNYGPWQFREKLIPVVILKAAAGEPIPLYGDGQNVRDWLYVEDHVDALLLAACRGERGRSYCVGGHGERTNKEVVEAICGALDALRPAGAPHARLITPVSDRPGHGPALCDRSHPHQHGAGLAAAPQFRGGAGCDGALVLGAAGQAPGKLSRGQWIRQIWSIDGYQLNALRPNQTLVPRRSQELQ